MQRSRTGAGLVLAVALSLGQAALAQDAGAGSAQRPGRQTALTAQRHMIVTANPLASEAGAAVLRAAAVPSMPWWRRSWCSTWSSRNPPASAAAPSCSTGTPRRSGSPASTAARPRRRRPGRICSSKPDGTPMAFDEAVAGGRSVGVPGTLALLELAHRLHGRLPWAELVEPAADLAEQGFAISPRLAGAIADSADKLAPFPATRAYFLGTRRRRRAQAGTMLRNPELAATLRADRGRGQRAALSRPDRRRDRRGGARRAGQSRACIDREDLARLPRGAARAGLPALPRVRGLRHGAAQLGRASRCCRSWACWSISTWRGSARPSDGMQALLEASKLAFADRNLYLADTDFVPRAGARACSTRPT